MYYFVCVCVGGYEPFWYVFVCECKYLVVFQVGEFPCSLTRCDSYNWVPFDFCRPEPRPTPPPLLFCHFLSSSQKWRELLGLFYCDLWVLSSTPICCLASDLDSLFLVFPPRFNQRFLFLCLLPIPATEPEIIEMKSYLLPLYFGKYVKYLHHCGKLVPSGSLFFISHTRTLFPL